MCQQEGVRDFDWIRAVAPKIRETANVGFVNVRKRDEPDTDEPRPPVKRKPTTSRTAAFPFALARPATAERARRGRGAI